MSIETCLSVVVFVFALFFFVGFCWFSFVLCLPFAGCGAGVLVFLPGGKEEIFNF